MMRVDVEDAGDVAIARVKRGAVEVEADSLAMT
jgi:hypothetical protein